MKKYLVYIRMHIKYHANGTTFWSKGMVVNEQPQGYWEWYRLDGTNLQYNMLQILGLKHFDNLAVSFGGIVTAIELVRLL